jgi:thiamine biosynthesis lipoprotein
VADPDAPNGAFSYMEISNKAVATSGNYEKFVTINGKKYSHTIDPKTGLPITGIKSVTIIASNAEFADAMATPIAVMGIKAGLFLIDQIPDLYCIIIDDNNKIYTSKKTAISIEKHFSVTQVKGTTKYLFTYNFNKTTFEKLCVL